METIMINIATILDGFIHITPPILSWDPHRYPVGGQVATNDPTWQEETGSERGGHFPKETQLVVACTHWLEDSGLLSAPTLHSRLTQLAAVMVR